MLRYHSRCSSNELIKTIMTDAEHKSKAAGYPATGFGFNEKGRCVDELGVERMLKMYSDDTSIISSTLKDELRLEGKDARLFRPVDACAFAESLRLFAEQNLYLTRLVDSPVFVRFKTPGPALTRLYQSLLTNGGSLYDADGSRWDANFQLSIAMVIANWRARNSPDPVAVMEYYRRVYNGFTHVSDGDFSFLVNLIGNSSGHLNTTTDNCLAHVCLMALHAYHVGMSRAKFYKQITWYCSGDDLVWADQAGLFSPAQLSETYANHGFYLEFSSLEPVEFERLTFVCTHPRWTWVNGTKMLVYTYDEDRLASKATYFRKKSTPVDQLMKIASVARLLYYSPSFVALRDLYDRFLFRHVDRNLLSLSSPEVIGITRSLLDSVLQHAYFSWEA